MKGDKIPWFGVGLVIIGAAILIQKLHLVELEFWSVFWPVMMLLALIGVSRGFARDRRASVVRRMFTNGSRRVIIRQAVSAET